MFFTVLVSISISKVVSCGKCLYHYVDIGIVKVHVHEFVVLYRFFKPFVPSYHEKVAHITGDVNLIDRLLIQDVYFVVKEMYCFLE